MNENERICYGCMSIIPKSKKICPFCSFTAESYNINPRSLPLDTLLHERYKIGRVIGEGGFGITYIGWDTESEEPVAIKEYFPSNVASRDCSSSGSNYIYFFTSKDEDTYKNGFDKYTKEAQTLQEFQDLDGIVSIRDFFCENNTAYIVMEYIEGITLKEYLATNGTLSPAETIELMTPVMVALEQIHKKGIIHRDISPDNIMIRMDGAFKLIDFGAARLTNDENGKSLTIILKRGFAPEEQYRTKGVQGPWTDVYALCATMYKTMTNIVPPESMERLVEDELIPLSDCNIDISRRHNKALMKGLSIKAKDRFQSIHELRLALTNDVIINSGNLHMIATFKAKNGAITGYRLFDLDNNEISDISAEELTEKLTSNEFKVQNLIVYQKYIQPIGGSLEHYPVLNTQEQLQSDNIYYFVEHSLSKGYLCLDYKGTRTYFNELQMQELMEKNHIANCDKLKIFITMCNKKKENSISKEVEAPSMPVTQPKPKKEPPLTKKLSLKTSESEYRVSPNDDKITKNVGTQLRLQMANQNHPASIHEKLFKKKKK